MPSILELCHGFARREFAAGDTLLEEGRTSFGLLYILIGGEVEIFKGSFKINHVTDSGAVFGEISVLLGIPHMATVRALTPCTAYVVEGADGFLKSHPEIVYHLCVLLAQRLHGVTGYLADLKRQYEDRKDHLSMVDDVLETLVHQQRSEFSPGSDRDPDL